MGKYVTLSGVKSWGDWETDTDDSLIDDMIDASYDIINNYTGRVFNASGATVVTYNRRTDYLGRFGSGKLELAQDLADELVSINSDAGYRIEYLPWTGPPYDTLVMVSGSFNYPRVRMTGYWGYSKTPPDAIKEANYRLVKWLYDMRQSNRSDTVIITPDGQVLLPEGLPTDVITILNPYRKVRLG